MNEQKFTELLGGIDPALIARAEAPVPMRKKPLFKRALIAAVAAIVAMSLLLGAAAIAMIPKTYDLDYEIPKNEAADRSVPIFYATENGKIKKQNVLLPPTEQNVFMTWKHLNGLGDEVQLLDYTVQADDTQAAAKPNTLWDSLRQDLSDSRKTVTVTVSASITSSPDRNELLQSLQKTLAEYAGVDPDRVCIQIDGQASVVVGDLLFQYTQASQYFIALAGSTLWITAGVTNISDKNLKFKAGESDFNPNVVLRMGSGDQQITLYPDSPSTTDELTQRTLAPGESRETFYTFRIPQTAQPGAYDLEISFQGYGFTFEQAVKIVNEISLADPENEFRAFMDEYGFGGDLMPAISGLTYQGTYLFDVMTPVPTEYPEGYDGEVYTSELFSFERTEQIGDSETTVFTAKALADGMVLPHGVTAEDSLIEALCKRGHDITRAKEVVEARNNVLFIGLAQSTSALWLKFYDSHIAFEYEYDGSTTMEIRYSADGTHFECLMITSSVEYTTAITEPVWPSSPDQVQLLSHATNHSLPDLIASRVLSACRNADWQATDLIPMTPSLTFTCGSNTVYYSPDDGMLNLGNYLYASVSESDRALLDALDAALNGWQIYYNSPPKYDVIVYLDGAYYGHNDGILAPETWQSSSAGISTEDTFVAVSANTDLTPYLQQHIEKQNDILCIGDAWFERIDVKSSSQITITGMQQTVITVGRNTDILIGILQKQQWTSGVIDLACNVQGSIVCDDERFRGDFRYNTYSRTFIVNKKYCKLSEDEAEDFIQILNLALVSVPFDSINIEIGNYRLSEQDCATVCNIFSNVSWDINVDGAGGSNHWLYIDNRQWNYDPEEGLISNSLLIGVLNEEQRKAVNEAFGFVAE